MTERALTLLVVDDEELNRDLLSRRLRRAGFAVVTATNGPEALDAIGRGGIDLVLLDVMMPGISGLDVIRRVRAAAASAQVPVIMVTAKVEAEMDEDPNFIFPASAALIVEDYGVERDFGLLHTSLSETFGAMRRTIK